MFNYLKKIIFYSIILISITSCSLFRKEVQLQAEFPGLLDQLKSSKQLLAYLKAQKQPLIKATFKTTGKQNTITVRFKGVYYYAGKHGEKLAGFDSLGRTAFNLLYNDKRFDVTTPEERLTGKVAELSNQYFSTVLLKNFRFIILERLPGDVEKVIIDSEKDSYIIYLFESAEDLKAIAWISKESGLLTKEILYDKGEKIEVLFSRKDESRVINIKSPEGNLRLNKIKIIAPEAHSSSLIKELSKL